MPRGNKSQTPKKKGGQSSRHRKGRDRKDGHDKSPTRARRRSQEGRRQRRTRDVRQNEDDRNERSHREEKPRSPSRKPAVENVTDSEDSDGSEPTRETVRRYRVVENEDGDSKYGTPRRSRTYPESRGHASGSLRRQTEESVRARFPRVEIEPNTPRRATEPLNKARTENYGSYQRGPGKTSNIDPETRPQPVTQQQGRATADPGYSFDGIRHWYDYGVPGRSCYLYGTQWVPAMPGDINAQQYAAQQSASQQYASRQYASQQYAAAQQYAPNNGNLPSARRRDNHGTQFQQPERSRTFQHPERGNCQPPERNSTWHAGTGKNHQPQPDPRPRPDDRVSVSRKALKMMFPFNEGAEKKALSSALELGKRMSSEDHGRVQYILRKPRFRKWISDGRSRVIVCMNGPGVMDEFDSCSSFTHYAGAMSFCQSNLDNSSCSMYFFAGFHKEKEFSLRPSQSLHDALLRSLLSQVFGDEKQLLPSLCLRMDAEKKRDLESGDTMELLHLLKRLLMDLANKSIRVLCMIDGAHFLAASEAQEFRWLYQMLSQVIEKVNKDSGIQGVVKVVLMYPARWDQSDLPEPDEAELTSNSVGSTELKLNNTGLSSFEDINELPRPHGK